MHDPKKMTSIMKTTSNTKMTSNVRTTSKMKKTSRMRTALKMNATLKMKMTLKRRMTLGLDFSWIGFVLKGFPNSRGIFSFVVFFACDLMVLFCQYTGALWPQNSKLNTILTKNYILNKKY